MAILGRSYTWARRVLSDVWDEHTRSFDPEALRNESHPLKAVLPVGGAATILIALMFLVPQARRFTGLDHPEIPIALLALGSAITIIQWRFWENQRLVHVLVIFDQALYCLAIVAVMVDTVSPTRYVWGLLYAQVAAHYGSRASFGWPLLFSISVIPFGATLAFAGDDFGLLALVLFGALMFVVKSTTTGQLRKVELEKERYRSAYEISDKIASDSLDIAIATSMAEFGNFAHELRNTATPMLGNLLILKEHQDLHPEIGKSVQSLERSFYRSGELTEKMLAGIRGRMVSDVSSFMLRDVLEQEMLGKGLPPGDRRKLHVDVKILPFEVKGNPEHLAGAIGNLLHNAVDAGAERVHVSASIQGGLRSAVITVEDDGPGMSDEAAENLFRPGVAGQNGESLGLGLLLARRLVEVLGGRLTLAKTGADGTCFEIMLPGRFSSREEEEQAS